MAGVQFELQRTRAYLQAPHGRIALLEAPKPDPSDPALAETGNHPAAQNGPDSASYERESRPWWRRWRGW